MQGFSEDVSSMCTQFHNLKSRMPSHNIGSSQVSVFQPGHFKPLVRREVGAVCLRAWRLPVVREDDLWRGVEKL